jgi:hypothetical protein
MKFAPRSRREFLQFIGTCTVPLLAAAPVALLHKPQQESPLDFDESLLNRERKGQAEMAILGNSMVYCRLDQKYLKRKLEPITATLIYKGGSRTLLWFLWMKNILGDCQPPPKLVFLFYRDYDFTNLKLHITGDHLDSIRHLMRDGDETYLRIARGMSTESGWKRWMNDHYAATAINKKVRRKIGDTAFDVAAIPGARQDHEVKEHVDAMFDLDRLRSDALDADAVANDSIDAAMESFTTDPAKTLLPHYVTVARALGIKLVFYRVKRRPDASQVTPQTEQLRKYTADFKAWAEREGHIHVDETDDPRITLEMFRDGDHLHKEAYRAYSDLFIERISALLPAPYTPEELKAASSAPKPRSD